MANSILIVEDNDDDFIAITRVFKNAGLRNPVQRCDCGDHALKCLLQQGQSDISAKPGLILLDLNMPGTDGRDVLRAVKSSPSLKHIPVIVITSSRESEEMTRSYNVGADSYLMKPIDMERFIKAVERLKVYGQYSFQIDMG